MAITLAQIPGFADVADSNFVAGQYAIGINFQRTVDNAKFGVVRPEVFVNRYINGDTVQLPTSPVDGYTYSREELTYVYHYALTGGTSTANNGAPTAAGAIRYMAPYVNQLTGAVTTAVEYLVANGSGPTVTTDGTIEVFTIATRRLTSLVVAAPPTYTPVLDSELATDDAVTQSIMQRINKNAKFAALRAEILYMGEFTDGETVPQPVSTGDGYVYSYAEVILQACWRWTTQGDQLVDPTNGNYKQLSGIVWSINPATGAVTIQVDYYNSGVYTTNNGRIAVFAFCQRAVTIGAGVVDFVDLSADFLASGRPCREDVMARQVENIRYAMVRREFFQSNHVNGDTVALPVSPVDGYAYSRDELTYIYDFNDTRVGQTDIRMQSWVCTIDQSTGLVTNLIVRVHDGGALVTNYSGQVSVLVVARRNHAGNSPTDLQYTLGGSGGTDVSALQNGGFDTWPNPAGDVAAEWALGTQSGSGYGAQSAGIASGYSQRLGAGASAGTFSVKSSSIGVTPGDLRFMSWDEQPSGGGSPTSSAISSISTTDYYTPSRSHVFGAPPPTPYYRTFTVDYVTPIAMSIGDTIPIAGNTVAAFNGTWTVSAVNSSTEVVVSSINYTAATGTGGTITHNPPAYGVGTISVILHFLDPIGDECTCTVMVETPASSVNERTAWIQIPAKGDVNVTTSLGQIPITGTLDFIPSVVRIEFLYTGTGTAAYVDLDEITFISQLNPSIGQIAQRGSDSLAFFPAIGFTVDDATFTPDLNFYINRADGTVTTVNGGTPVVSGLAGSTTYFWYPYLNELTGNIGSVGDSAEIPTAGVGTPPWLQSTATRAAYASWFGISHLPLAAAPIQVITAAPAAPPSGGSGGGGGTCLKSTMWVRAKRGFIQMKDVLPGDFLLGENGSWLEVTATGHRAWSKWCFFKFNHGGGIEVTSHHVMDTLPDDESTADDESFRLVRASDMTVSTQVPCESGVCHPVTILYEEHEAELVSLLLQHPHRFYATDQLNTPMTLMTARMSSVQCGCKGAKQ
jgi:hypothetical protein